MSDFRIGQAFDAHAFSDDPNRPMMLSLLHWPGERGLEGHSDADVVAHAICDALLSAARMGDLGSNYGTDRPEFANASGRVFLCDVMDRISQAGWNICNVSAQVIGNRPRMMGRIDECQSALEEIIKAPVSVSATTTDGMGFLGRGEGVACIASALISK